MANISIEGLEEIMTATENIQKMINRVKPWGITHREVLALANDIEGHIHVMTENVDHIRRVSDEWKDKGFID